MAKINPLKPIIYFVNRLFTLFKWILNLFASLLKNLIPPLKANFRYSFFFALSILVHLFFLVELFPSPEKQLLHLIKAQVYTQTETRALFEPIPLKNFLEELNLFAGMKDLFLQDPHQTSKLEALVIHYQTRSPKILKEGQQNSLFAQKDLLQQIKNIQKHFAQYSQKLYTPQTPLQTLEAKKYQQVQQHLHDAEKSMAQVFRPLEKNDIPVSVGYQADTLYFLWEAYKKLYPQKTKQEIAIRLKNPDEALAEKLKELEKVAKEIEKTRKQMEKLQKKETPPEKKPEKEPPPLAKKEEEPKPPPTEKEEKKEEPKKEEKKEEPKKEEKIIVPGELKKMIEKSKIEPTEKEIKKIAFRENIERSKNPNEEIPPPQPEKKVEPEPKSEPETKEEPSPKEEIPVKEDLPEPPPPKEIKDPLKEEVQIPIPPKPVEKPIEKPIEKNNSKSEIPKTKQVITPPLKTEKSTPVSPPQKQPKTNLSKKKETTPKTKTKKTDTPKNTTNTTTKSTTPTKKATIQTQKQYQEYLEQTLAEQDFEGMIVPQLRVDVVPVQEWMAIASAMNLTFVAYPRANNYLLIQKGSQIVALKTKKDIENYLKSYSERVLDRRSQVPDLYENFQQSPHYVSGDGKLLLVNLFPISFANYIAWKQIEVCKRNGYDPKEVKYTYARFELATFKQYVLVVYKIRLTNGEIYDVKDFEEEKIFGSR